MDQTQGLDFFAETTGWMLFVNTKEEDVGGFGFCSLENERQQGRFYQLSSNSVPSSQSWSDTDIELLDVSLKKTPFEERDDLTPAEDRLMAMIDRLSDDDTLPFYDQIIDALTYLSEPDPIDEEAPLSLKATTMFLRFMREPFGFVEPPLLSVGVNGGLVAGWRKGENRHIFLYFMGNGIVQYASRRPSGVREGPPTVPTSGVLPRIFDAPWELEVVKNTFRLVFPWLYS